MLIYYTDFRQTKKMNQCHWELFHKLTCSEELIIIVSIKRWFQRNPLHSLRSPGGVTKYMCTFTRLCLSLSIQYGQQSCSVSVVVCCYFHLSCNSSLMDPGCSATSSMELLPACVKEPGKAHPAFSSILSLCCRFLSIYIIKAIFWVFPMPVWYFCRAFHWL